MDIQVTELPGVKVACVNQVGYYYQSCKHVWGKLCRWANKNHQLSPNTTFIGICYDNPLKTNPAKIRYDACLSINKHFSPDKEIKIKQISAGKYVKAIHIGSCATLKDTYEYVLRVWMPSYNKKALAAPCIEIYKNDPDTTPEDELITEIYIPIKS